MIQPPSSQAHTDSILWALPFCPMDWELTPPAVQDVHPKPASTDQTTPATRGNPARPGGENVANLQQASIVGFPFDKPKRTQRQSSGKRGGRPGHSGKGPTLLRPTEVHLIAPGPCVCGHGELVSLAPYYTHQVVELPPIAMDIQHFILHQGTCRGGGRTLKAQVPKRASGGLWPALDGAHW